MVNGVQEANSLAVSEKSGRVIENAYLRVEADEAGRVSVLDKATGRRLEDAFELEDTADQGDSYLYYEGAGAPIYGRDFPAEVKLVRSDALVQELAVTRRMQLPARYDFDRRCRTEETKETVVSLTLRLKADTPAWSWTPALTTPPAITACGCWCAPASRRIPSWPTSPSISWGTPTRITA